MISIGSVVRFKKEWCTEVERNLIGIVLENRINPVTMKNSRWLIEIQNTDCYFKPTEVVEAEMIEEIEL